MEELALKIEHVSKEYRLGTIGGGTLKAELQGKFAMLRHKENPNLKIGQKEHDRNERFLALDDVSLEIKKGERVAIIGHNGAGKSTLLKLICRVTAPTKGNIYLNGRITSMLEVGTGFHGELTGEENIYLNGAILGMSKEEVQKKYDEIVEFSEIGQFINTPVKRYSSGMRVKLGFSVASHLDSEIMIMDEVLAVGDVTFQNKCLDKMRLVAEDEGRTIIYVSHNMRTIRQLCERCIVLDHGKIIFDGEVEDAISIYLNAHANENIYVDFQGIRRLDYLPDNPAIKFTSAEFRNKDNNVFVDGEKINLKLCWQNLETINNVSLRIEILSKSRIPVTAVNFKSFYSGEKGDTGCATIEIKTDLLVSETYAMNYTLFYLDEYGTSHDIDCVFGLYCEIKHTEEMRWSKNNWGYIKFNDCKLIDVK